jgi:hypothetical protein
VLGNDGKRATTTAATMKLLRIEGCFSNNGRIQNQTFSMGSVLKHKQKPVLKYVRFKGFTEVNRKNGIFWDVTLCGSCISSQCASIASYGYVPSSPILVTLMMEALRYSETSVLTRPSRRNILGDAILQVLK